MFNTLLNEEKGTRNEEIKILVPFCPEK